MKTKPRDIGTAAETATVKQLRKYWPTADRSPLRGNRDQGDIQGTGAFIWEIKAGRAAREINTALLNAWLAQTEIERLNAGVDFGVLVTTRLGYGPKNANRWWAWLPISRFSTIIGGAYYPPDGNDYPVRMELGDLLEILADQGYTPDIEPAAASLEETAAELMAQVAADEDQLRG